MKSNTILTTFILLLSTVCMACSALVLKKDQQIFMGKNFDWTFGDGYLIKNIRGVQKQAFITYTGIPTKWISKYGSITFNQNGKEMPYGGMNEKGLTIEMLWLEFTNYGDSSGKNYLNELEWIQYQLDNFESINEVLENLNKLQIRPIKGKIHYILADSSGNSVVIDFINNKPIVTNKMAHECQAITNYPATTSQLNYNKQIGKLKGTNSSHLHRYNVLQRELEAIQFKNIPITVEAVFESLENVKISKGKFKTYWSIAYDIKQKLIYFKTESCDKVKQMDIKLFNFEQEITACLINTKEKGSLNTKFKPYDVPANTDLLKMSLLGLGLNLLEPVELSQHQFYFNSNQDNSYVRNYTTLVLLFKTIDSSLAYINFAIIASEENFLNQIPIAGGANGYNIDSNEYTWLLYGVQKGPYCVAVVQDKNRNRKIDLNEMGLAIEKYAFSKNCRLGDGKYPKFMDCSVPCATEKTEFELILSY
ncbi:MAG: linear amide C-N hydrolase [Saprospiraceae bacterium]